MISRDDVVSVARSYLGTPWRHLGRSEHGLDCVGLIVVVCSILKLSGYDLKTYPREPRSSEFLEHFLRGGGTRVALDAAFPGDLVLFREQRYPCHVAFLSERDGLPTIIHAHATRRAVLEEVLVSIWLAKRLAAIRLPGVS